MMEMEGDSTGGIPRVIWIPEGEEPDWNGEGIGDPRLHKVPGGWTFTAEPQAGGWSVRIQGG